MAPDVSQSRRKNKFLRMNYLAKNSRRQDLKNSIQVVLKTTDYEDPPDILPHSYIDSLSQASGHSNGVPQGGIPIPVGSLSSKNTGSSSPYLPSRNQTPVPKESEFNSSFHDPGGPYSDRSLQSNGTVTELAREEVVTRGVLAGKATTAAAADRSVTVYDNVSTESLTFFCGSSGDTLSAAEMKDASAVVEENQKSSSKKERHPQSPPLNDRKVKKESEEYEEEEYVEDLAQLDVLLHYVNNLSASLEFLDWEKNKSKFLFFKIIYLLVLTLHVAS